MCVVIFLFFLMRSNCEPVLANGSISICCFLFLFVCSEAHSAFACRTGAGLTLDSEPPSLSLLLALHHLSDLNFLAHALSLCLALDIFSFLPRIISKATLVHTFLLISAALTTRRLVHEIMLHIFIIHAYAQPAGD